jgi:hypothetical protein
MNPPSPPPARSSRLVSVSSLFSKSKTLKIETPTEKKRKPQDLDEAFQKAPMEQQGAQVVGSGGVRFKNIKIGKGCAIVMVSTIGKEVDGEDIEIDDHTSWHTGQMSPESLGGLPKAYGTQESSVKDESTEDSRYGQGHVLGGAASTSSSAKRPTW